MSQNLPCIIPPLICLTWAIISYFNIRKKLTLDQVCFLQNNIKAVFHINVSIKYFECKSIEASRKTAISENVMLWSLLK